MYFHNSLIPRGAYFLLAPEAASRSNLKCILKVKVNQLKCAHVKMETYPFKCHIFTGLFCIVRFLDPKFIRDINTYRQSFQDDTCISDIYHGSLYKENREFLSQPFNISLLWHTDGVSVYKSSDLQIWPVQAVINELPLRKR